MSHAASPRQALTALHDYLAAHVDADLLPCAAETLDRLLGADDRWANPATMMDPSRSVGQSAEARELLLLADDLVALLDAETPRLIAASSRDGWDRARLYGRAATGLLRYHFWMADTSPGRVTRLLGLRSSMIALATSRWTRPTWPGTTGSCSSRTSGGARFPLPSVRRSSAGYSSRATAMRSRSVRSAAIRWGGIASTMRCSMA
ncbi:erythromycin esterase family protein [Nonomuraea sp. NPDC003727]